MARSTRVVVPEIPRLLTAIRYVLINPVRAGLVVDTADWRWSSVHAHLASSPDDSLTDTALPAALVPDFLVGRL